MPGEPRPRRACDRCHSLKERCRWSDESTRCDRCERLDQACQTDRPAQKIGRKPRNRPINLGAMSAKAISPPVLESDYQSVDLSSNTLVWSPGLQRPPDVATPDSMTDLATDIKKSLSAFGDLDELERAVLELCFSREEAVGQFTIGKSFHRMHQRDLLIRLSTATVQLKDGFICCGAMFAQSLDVTLPPPVLDMCQRRAANAVSSLRALEISSRQDISTCLVLGLVVTTFALYVAGGETYSICRWVLSQLKPLYEKGIDLAPDELSFFNCLVFTEIVECLLQGHVPTLQFKIESETEADRYFGLSTPVMAHLYDICMISNKLRRSTAGEDLQAELDCLEHQVRKWRPKIPFDVLDRFDQSEIVNILAQAKSLRLTVLLLIHRLRFPFGQRSEHGRALSETVLTEIELAKQVTGHIAEGLDLCCIVAFLELGDNEAREEALSVIDMLVQYSQRFRDKLKDQITTFWAARDAGCIIYWYNLPQYLPP